MYMEKTNSRGNRFNLLKTACLAALALFGVASCEQYDLDEHMPEWLGASIYEYLDQNGYDTYVKLIDDLGYHDIMSKTGSKTLFVADEEAVARFFKSGIFKKEDGITPVSSYEDLTTAQKKLLLYGSMLNNVYQVAMLSSSEGPTKGDCMRRVSSTSIYDSVRFIAPTDMPNNPYFQYYEDNGKSLRLMNDATLKPMVFFVNKFLTAKKITDDDYDFLFNQGAYDKGTGAAGREPADASVNGTIIEEQNIKCLNGFVHVMKEVIYPLPNMADYLNSNPQTSIYDALLERFCAPYYAGDDVTNDFNRLYPAAAVDSVFEKRYFAVRSKDGSELAITPSRGPVPAELKFDPGWNTYFSSTSATTTNDVALQQNMGVMLVPNNDAMITWWTGGGGAPLKDRFGKDEYAGMTSMTAEQVIEDMAGVPDNTIVKLLNNNMLNSFVGSVPSKFDNVLDDANDPMGITVTDVDSVKMCCNGGIYFTNKVFSPTAYRSVSFPALVNEELQIIYWAIEQFEFDAYLNSMVATYSFFIPSVVTDPSSTLYNKLIYIDPVSGGTKYSQAFVFYYDAAATEKAEQVKADIYGYDASTGVIDETTLIGKATTAQVEDRLTDLLDYHIIIGDVQDGYEYYQTKGRGTVKFEKVGDDFYVSGGYQIENDTPLKVKTVYDMTTANGNGRTYIIEEPLATSSRSVYDVVSDNTKYPKFSLFFDLMNSSGLFENTRDNHQLGSINMGSFNTYHYTIYVPSNESLQAMIDAGDLMTFDDIDAEEAYYDGLMSDNDTYVAKMIELSRFMRDADPSEPNTSADSVYQHTEYIAYLENTLRNFVKYHVQDNSVYYGGEFKIDTIHTTSREANYETAYMNENLQFAKVAVRSDKTGIFITDEVGNTRKVVLTDDNYYNIMCREYEYNASVASTELETSSYAVVHMIDAPLCNGVTFKKLAH